MDLTALIESLDFGYSFSGEAIRKIAGIELPKTGTYKQFQQAELQELQIIGAIRDHLLRKGMYLKRDGENYRVLLPSENAAQIKRMNESAKRKYNRALLLEKNTPKDSESAKVVNSTFSRLINIKKLSGMHALMA